MSTQLYNAGIEILAMGYYKNENARSGDYNPGMRMLLLVC